MSNRKISQFQNLAGAQTPTMTIPVVNPAAGSTSAGNRKTTLNDLFADLAINTSDRGVSMTGVATVSAPSLSSAGKAKFYYDITLNQQMVSTNGSAYFASINQTAQNAVNLSANSTTINLIGGGLYTVAAAQAGASTTAKLDAAMALGGVVAATTQLASATAVPTTLTPGVVFYDQRGGAGYDFSGGFSTSFQKGINYALKDTTVYGATIANPAVLRCFYNPQSGGYSTLGGPKTNYQILGLDGLYQTIGQGNGLSVSLNKTSSGDAQAVVGVVYYSSHMRDQGDEGACALRGAIYQSSTPFSATISGVAGNIISYSSASYISERGEERYLIKLGSGTYTTGTVSGVAGTPPIVTGIGTSWLSLGSGAVSNLFFSFTQDTATYGIKHVVRIRSINSNTQLTLDYVTQGADNPWPVQGAQSGAYIIFHGTTITKVLDNTLQVADGSQFSIGDSVESPISHGMNATTVNLTLYPQLPTSRDLVFFNMVNPHATLPVDVVQTSGRLNRGFLFNSAFSSNIIYANSTIGGSFFAYDGTTPNLNLFQLLNNAGTGYNFLQHNKATDSFQIQNATIVALSVKTTGFVAINGNASTGTRMLISAAAGEVGLELRQTTSNSNYFRLTNTFTSKTVDLVQDNVGNFILQNASANNYYDAVTSHNFRISGANAATLTNALFICPALTVGSGLSFSKISYGTGTFVTGAAIISDTRVAANSKIFIIHTSASNVGTPYISSKTAGTGFTANSTNLMDASTFDYFFVNP